MNRSSPGRLGKQPSIPEMKTGTVGLTSAPCLTCRCEGPRRKKAELEVSSFYSVRELETCKGSSAGKKPDKGWVSDTTPATVRESVCPRSLAH